jgi:hypothetical protein
LCLALFLSNDLGSITSISDEQEGYSIAELLQLKEMENRQEHQHKHHSGSCISSASLSSPISSTASLSLSSSFPRNPHRWILANSAGLPEDDSDLEMMSNDEEEEKNDHLNKQEHWFEARLPVAEGGESDPEETIEGRPDVDVSGLSQENDEFFHLASLPLPCDAFGSMEEFLPEQKGDKHKVDSSAAASLSRTQLRKLRKKVKHEQSQARFV